MGTLVVSSPIMIVISVILICVEIGPLGLLAVVFFIISSILNKDVMIKSFMLRGSLLV
jgi:hypothetical protein